MSFLLLYFLWKKFPEHQLQQHSSTHKPVSRIVTGLSVQLFKGLFLVLLMLSWIQLYFFFIPMPSAPVFPFPSCSSLRCAPKRKRGKKSSSVLKCQATSQDICRAGQPCQFSTWPLALTSHFSTVFHQYLSFFIQKQKPQFTEDMGEQVPGTVWCPTVHYQFIPIPRGVSRHQPLQISALLSLNSVIQTLANGFSPVTFLKLVPYLTYLQYSIMVSVPLQYPMCQLHLPGLICNLLQSVEE